MSDIPSLQHQIRSILDAETDAIRLSDALFRPDGLFARMAPTRDERRAVAESPLFKEAQRRLAELRRKEAREFSKSVDAAQLVESAAAPRLHRVERV